MRYQALELYSGILRAVGWLVAIGTVAGAPIVVLGLGLFGSAILGSIAVIGAIIVGVVGLVHGLALVAIGQLLCVVIDIEANTRVAARQEWHLDR